MAGMQLQQDFSRKSGKDGSRIWKIKQKHSQKIHNFRKQKKTVSFNVPKIICTLSRVYIVFSSIAGLLSLMVDINAQGKAALSQLQILLVTLSNVITGFLFWGIGLVFSKFLGKK